MAKKAVLVGINYPGTSHELRGCVNDVMAVAEVLRTNYHFDSINIITDNNATTDNILNALEDLVVGNSIGDVLYFHFSGHGSQMLDDSDPDYEPDGLDEIICPVDLDWHTKVIRDDDLKRIFDLVQPGVNLSVTLDCCNSGGGLDQENQYQSLGEAREVGGEDPMKQDKIFGLPEGIPMKNPPKGDSKWDTPWVGRFLTPPDEVLKKAGDRAMKPRAVNSKNVNQTGLLISGCQSHQTSADAWIEGKWMGACTFALLQGLAVNKYNVSYKNLVDGMNQFMVERGYTQRPELNGPENLFSRAFAFNGFEAEDTIIIDNSVNDTIVTDVDNIEDVFTHSDEALDIELDEMDGVEPTNDYMNNEPDDSKMLNTVIVVAIIVIIIAAGTFFSA